MNKLIKILFGLFLLWLPIATVIYLFSNGPVGEVKDAKISNLVGQSLRLIDDGAEAIKQRESKVENIISLKGGDGSVTLYHALTRKKDVRNVKIIEISSQPLGNGESLDLIDISFTYKNSDAGVFFLVDNKRSFMHPFDVEIVGVDHVEIMTSHKITINDPDMVANFLIDAAIGDNIHSLGELTK